MKIKSHSGAKKRVKVNAKGLKSFKKSCKNHLLTAKSKRQKSIKTVAVPSTHAQAINRLLANS
jgi:ribosomal protein L35